MPKIRFVKTTRVNGVEYKANKVLNVVKSMYNALLNSGDAVDALAENKKETIEPPKAAREIPTSDKD